MSALGNPLSCILLGFAAGARTTAAPMLAHQALRARSTPRGDGLVELASSDRTGHVLRVGTAVEMVIDKLPGVGDRTAPFGVAARAISGAVSSATVAAAYGRNKWLGAALGGASAIAGTYALFHLRGALHRHTPVPDFVVGLAEDALVFGLGRLALRS
jgi:uncharacterized membrane protein